MSDKRDQPWWKVRMLWLVIGGPLVVVVASFVTLGLALRNPDPVIKPSVEISAVAQQKGASAPETFSQVPALQARNHSATAGQ